MAGLIGIRFRTYSMSIGSAFDWFIPEADMPAAGNVRGYEVFRDTHMTPHGNSFLYDKGKIKKWNLEFEDITTLSKERLEHIAHGWLGSRQITMLYYGTSVIGTTETPGSMASAGQLWGTGWVQLNDLPHETAADLWNVSLTITQFGPDQNFQ